MKKRVNKNARLASNAANTFDGDAIDDALNQAALDAVLEHKKAGRPLAVWQDDKTVWVRPEDVKVREMPVKRTVRRPRRRKTG